MRLLTCARMARDYLDLALKYVNDLMMHQEVGRGDGHGGVGAKRTVLGDNREA